MLRIAVQSKGRLYEDTMQLLSEADIKVTASKRTLLVSAQNFPLEVLYLRDDDIPQSVATGVADIGVVGENEYQERGAEADIISRLGFSRCRLSLAIPKDIDYQGLEWFNGKTIATSYPVILNRFLDEHHIHADVHVITGSVEISPGIGLAVANIVFPESLESIGYYALYGTAWERLQPDGLIYAANVAYKYKGEMPEGTSIVLREGTKGIASRAFNGFSSLVAITLPNTVTNIGNYAFEGCNHLTQVNLPESLTYISHNAFKGCPLSSLVIPSGITWIGDNTFPSIVAPKVICFAPTPPRAYYETFSYSVYQNSTLYVPKESLEAYQSSYGWCYFKTIVGFETQNYLSVEDMTALHGDTIIIPISMTNIDDITAVQADIFLPDGMELVQEDDEYLIEPSDRLPLNTVLMSNDVSSGGVRVLCYTSNGEPISGNEGDLFYLTVKVAEDAQGDYPITLRNIVLTTPDPLDLTVLDDSAYVHVLSYLLGDANCSKAVTVSDIVTTARYILDMNPEPFDFEAADVNADNSITASDIVLIMHIIMDKPMMNGPQRQPDMRGNNDRLSGDNIQLKPGETRRVSIALDNALDYTAFQFDLSLPEGLTASNFSLTDRASAHSLDANMLQNGNTRVLSYSPQLAAIANSEGTLLTFDVTAATTVTGDITASDIEFVTPDGGSVHFAPITIGVNSMTAVDEFTTSKQVTRVDYFDLSGQQLSQPATGVNIIVTTYSDGTRSVAKVNK